MSVVSSTRGSTSSLQSVGQKGPSGDRGRQGEKGPPGDSSTVKGTAGPQGYQGRSGVIGPRGDRGEKGEVGRRGNKGIQGLEGKRGPIGRKGTDGERGKRGPQGIQGDVGNVGPRGDALAFPGAQIINGCIRCEEEIGMVAVRYCALNLTSVPPQWDTITLHENKLFMYLESINSFGEYCPLTAVMIIRNGVIIGEMNFFRYLQFDLSGVQIQTSELIEFLQFQIWLKLY